MNMKVDVWACSLSLRAVKKILLQARASVSHNYLRLLFVYGFTEQNGHKNLVSGTFSLVEIYHRCVLGLVQLLLLCWILNTSLALLSLTKMLTDPDVGTSSV